MSTAASAATDMVKVFVFFLKLDDPAHFIFAAIENLAQDAAEDAAENAAQSLFSQCVETVMLENADAAAPSAVFFNNDIYMFYPNLSNGEILYNVFNGSSWGAQTQIPNDNICTGSPSAVVLGDLIYVFYQNANNGGLLCYTTFDGTNWAGSTVIPNRALSDSPSAVLFNGQIYVFYQSSGSTGLIYYSVSSNGSDWGTTDTQMPNANMSCSPSATVNGTELYVFYQGPGNDKNLYYASSTNGNSWTTQVQVPNVSLVASPAVVACNGNIYAFYIGTGNQLNQIWHTDLINGSWTTPTQVAPMQMTASPSAVTFPTTAPNNLYYFFQGVGNSGVLWCAVSNGTGIQNMYQLFEGQSIMSCTPGPVVYNNELYVFYHVDPDSSATLNYITSSDGVNWSDQNTTSGAGLTDSPSAVEFNNKLYVFYQGEGNADTLWYSTYDGSWSGSSHIKIGMWYSPSAVVFNGSLYVFYRGSEDAQNGQLWYVVSSDGTAFTQNQPTLGGGEDSPCYLAESPAAVVFNNTLYVFSGGASSAELQYITSTNGSDWSPLLGVGGDIGSSDVPQISAWPAAAVLGDTLYVLYQSAADSKLGWAYTTDGSNWTLSPEPPSNSAQNPFACLFTLTQAEFNALDNVLDT